MEVSESKCIDRVIKSIGVNSLRLEGLYITEISRCWDFENVVGVCLILLIQRYKLNKNTPLLAVNEYILTKNKHLIQNWIQCWLSCLLAGSSLVYLHFVYCWSIVYKHLDCMIVYKPEFHIFNNRLVKFFQALVS